MAPDRLVLKVTFAMAPDLEPWQTLLPKQVCANVSFSFSHKNSTLQILSVLKQFGHG